MYVACIISLYMISLVNEDVAGFLGGVSTDRFGSNHN